uniref:Glyoxalase family protein n=1 Tax=endosymbiont of Ridgeia piscesae TaxID=54398 RepID=D2CL11_9GAMM|nr:glyoxalase family protein [endosymbiont of Ridgeia piscesae]
MRSTKALRYMWVVKHSYVALYTKGNFEKAADSYSRIGGINHIAVVVDDLDAVEARVKEAGLTPRLHGRL